MKERIKRLREQSLRATNTFSAERAKLVTEFYASGKAEKHSIPVQRALCFKYIMSNKAICINDGELIVGERGPAPKATSTSRLRATSPWTAISALLTRMPRRTARLLNDGVLESLAEAGVRPASSERHCTIPLRWPYVVRGQPADAGCVLAGVSGLRPAR